MPAFLAGETGSFSLYLGFVNMVFLRAIFTNGQHLTFLQNWYNLLQDTDTSVGTQAPAPLSYKMLSGIGQIVSTKYQEVVSSGLIGA